jgi:lipopolysaccharide transport system ATP-binding protein
VNPPQVQIEGVWKSYPAWSAGSRTLRGIVSRRIPLLARGSDRRWVLNDVSLEAERGQAVGLIGQNGAGKSTLLRLASGVGRVDRGTIRVPERTASVLSFDSWFDLDLTGRENAMTALVVNGWRRAEARELIAAVLEFAELESFADAPVRTYSEGMKLRLAFGVVAQLDPEVLLIDEVISVGDLRFQKKCMDRLREMRERGMTLIMASHGLEQVEAECDRALWLQAGGVRAYGEPARVIEEYRSAMASATLERTPAAEPGSAGGLELRRNRFGNQELTIDSVRMLTEEGAPLDQLQSGRPLRIALRLSTTNSSVDDPIVGIAIHRASDGVICYDTSTESSGVRLGVVEGELAVDLEFERLDLLPGDYLLDVGVYRGDWEFAYDFHWQAYPLKVIGSQSDKGVFRPPHHWEVAR